MLFFWHHSIWVFIDRSFAYQNVSNDPVCYVYLNVYGKKHYRWLRSSVQYRFCWQFKKRTFSERLRNSRQLLLNVFGHVHSFSFFTHGLVFFIFPTVRKKGGHGNGKFLSVQRYTLNSHSATSFNQAEVCSYYLLIDWCKTKNFHPY